MKPPRDGREQIVGQTATVRRKLNPGLTGRDAEKLEQDLRKRIIGQDEAVKQIINVYQMFLAGMNSPGQPVGNFLFLGPTGTGKTRVVDATAESLLGDSRAVIKIDCAEFQHSHEIAKLIGSPPGYLGHRETHPLLSQEVLDQHLVIYCKLFFISDMLATLLSESSSCLQQRAPPETPSR